MEAKGNPSPPPPTLPANYVTLRQLQELRLKQKPNRGHEEGGGGEGKIQQELTREEESSQPIAEEEDEISEVPCGAVRSEVYHRRDRPSDGRGRRWRIAMPSSPNFDAAEAIGTESNGPNSGEGKENGEVVGRSKRKYRKRKKKGGGVAETERKGEEVTGSEKGKNEEEEGEAVITYVKKKAAEAEKNGEEVTESDNGKSNQKGGTVTASAEQRFYKEKFVKAKKKNGEEVIRSENGNANEQNGAVTASVKQRLYRQKFIKNSEAVTTSGKEKALKGKAAEAEKNREEATGSENGEATEEAGAVTASVQQAVKENYVKTKKKGEEAVTKSAKSGPDPVPVKPIGEEKAAPSSSEYRPVRVTGGGPKHTVQEEERFGDRRLDGGEEGKTRTRGTGSGWNRTVRSSREGRYKSRGPGGCELVWVKKTTNS
ncbi:uncharacterized protein [Typha angustifolia]|uniref:uncharacterized protein n=1 Tax=Typha angustifolia TaxID=59011 RepID=UPI003C2F21EA